MFSLIFICMMHVRNPLFHGANDENVSIPIWAHHEALEHQERYPNGVEQDKNLMVGWNRGVIHVAALIFDDKNVGNIFTSIFNLF